MSLSCPSPVNLADPARLALLHASFRLACEELGRPLGSVTPEYEPQGNHSEAADEAAHLAAILKTHFANIERPELEQLRAELGRSLLLELDRKMAAPGVLPGEHVDMARIPDTSSCSGSASEIPRVGLVSLPWMSPALPSIQLATLASALDRQGIASDVHELYVDYAARIGLNLYNHLSNLLGFLPEWVFTQHYYGPEIGDDLSAMKSQRPLKDIPWPEFADDILEALAPVTLAYLDDMVETTDWSRYDILGCSLTISQLGASMAFVRRLKLRYPQLKIIFGGSQCAGPMGRAILRICSYVDAVVHVEGELVLADLVRRFRGNISLEGLPGVSSRVAGDEIVTGSPGGLYRGGSERLSLSYDPYFRRLMRLGLLEKMNPWLPFEGSRGCWYGQKTQCTFCGLHEIMEFRARDADAVLADLERMYAHYGIPRFYAMDLILPREYFRTLLPSIVARGHQWMFFWEVKANMRREEIEVLAAAGVRWLQPGIESLDQDILRLMKKGVSPLQNILLLKWCQELAIFCGWNLIEGLPGENQASYDRMAAIIPSLHHLQPPSGGGRFQLHRFSPYFDHPEQFGLTWTGAHPMFQYAFPIPKPDLDELVYLHEFVDHSTDKPVDNSALRSALKGWQSAFGRGATLRFSLCPDGSSRIEDSRAVDSPARVYDLTKEETSLYLLLDSGVNHATVEQAFRLADPDAARRLDRAAGVMATVEQWRQNDLVLEIDRKFVALALHTARSKPDRPEHSARTPVRELNFDPLVSIDLIRPDFEIHSTQKKEQ
jgi:ribosomal peptide maturation radical SAM protein 1